MRLKEIIAERSFEGRRCTRDCSGHYAGYKYTVDRKKTSACNSRSASFNTGCEIGADQVKRGQITKPRVRL
jgi:hypothetical protein